jgi:hypothetical protein
MSKFVQVQVDEKVDWAYVDGWPEEPRQIQPPIRKVLLRCMGDIIMVLLATGFFIFAILVRVYDGSPRFTNMTDALEISARFV